MGPPMTRARAWGLAAVALGLFLIWSNAFVAVGFLVGSDRAAARLDWLSLTVARFLPVTVFCLVYCLGWQARASWACLRQHGGRLLACGLLSVPGYNLALYYGQQHGVPAPIASLTTALLPLLVMLMAALFLGERITTQRLAGFAVAVAGMAVVASAPRADPAAPYGLMLAVTALAPLSWSLYTVLSKPVAGRVPALLWTYLSLAVGGLLLAPLVPFTWPALVALDGPGWAAVTYLSLPSTVLGFAVWTWLLGQLPASTVGFTVFLNPPLTTVSKLLLASAAPAVFIFAVTGQELAGSAVVLVGLGLATWRRR